MFIAAPLAVFQKLSHLDLKLTVAFHVMDIVLQVLKNSALSEIVDLVECTQEVVVVTGGKIGSSPYI